MSQKIDIDLMLRKIFLAIHVAAGLVKNIFKNKAQLTIFNRKLTTELEFGNTAMF